MVNLRNLCLIIEQYFQYVKHRIFYIYCTTMSTLMVNTFLGLFLPEMYGEAEHKIDERQILPLFWL